MKKTKAFISALLITAMSASMFACGDEEAAPKYDKDLDAETREEIKKIASESELLTGDLENGTIK